MSDDLNSRDANAFENNDGIPARKSLKGVHPAQQHSSIMRIFLGLKEALESLLADHH